MSSIFQIPALYAPSVEDKFKKSVVINSRLQEGNKDSFLKTFH